MSEITSLTNFTPLADRSFKDSQYTDIRADHWAITTGALETSYMYGIMGDSHDGSFRGNDAVTGEQAAKIAATLHAQYTGRTIRAWTDEEHWSVPYVEYGKYYGLWGSEIDALLKTPLTRTQAVGLLSDVLEDTDLAARNTVNSLPDVNENHEQYDTILRFYQAGILTGNDDTGTFGGGGSFTRYQMAAIASRLASPELRLEGLVYG